MVDVRRLAGRRSSSGLASVRCYYSSQSQVSNSTLDAPRIHVRGSPARVELDDDLAIRDAIATCGMRAARLAVLMFIP